MNQKTKVGTLRARQIGKRLAAKTKTRIMQDIVGKLSSAANSGGIAKKDIASDLAQKYPTHNPIGLARSVQWLVSASRNHKPWAIKTRGPYLHGLELHAMPTRPLRFFITRKPDQGQSGTAHTSDKTDMKERHVRVDSTTVPQSGKNCTMCKSGETKPGKATESFTRGETIVIVKDIPAQVCSQCGEPYFDGDVAKVIEQLVNDAVRKGAEVEILRYAA